MVRMWPALAQWYFNLPQGIATDTSGNIYVADTGNDRIQKFDVNGVFITQWGGYGTGDGQFDQPNRITVDSSGNVYVTDKGNNRIQKFDSGGTFITKWGTSGTADGQFYGPKDVTIDSSGNVYVADSNNGRIQKFTSVGGLLDKWGSYGSDNGQLVKPGGVVVPPNGHIYVSDTNNHRIVEVAFDTVPQLNGTVPSNGATGVSASANITVTFNETIQAGSAYNDIAVKDSANNTVTIGKSISGGTLTIDPVSNLSYETTYTVTIPSGAIKDSANQIAVSHEFSFTTGSAPPASGGGGGGGGQPEDKTAPVSPKNVKATSNDGTVSLTWDKNGEDDIAGYNIYRKEKGQDDLLKINASVVVETQYQDATALSGKTYIYCISAVDKSANESQMSAEVEVVTAGGVLFSDVASNAWYNDYVAKLVGWNIIAGYSDGTFRPDKTVTRAEFAKMICLAMGWQLENKSTASFSDVAKDSWMFKYVETAKAHGAIDGYKGGEFRPGRTITRAEIAKIIAKALNLPSGVSTLKDINDSWAKEYINACVKASIIGGYSDNTFKPGNAATRAESAKMVVKMLEHK